MKRGFVFLAFISLTVCHLAFAEARSHKLQPEDDSKTPAKKSARPSILAGGSLSYTTMTTSGSTLTGFELGGISVIDVLSHQNFHLELGGGLHYLVISYTGDVVSTSLKELSLFFEAIPLFRLAKGTYLGGAISYDYGLNGSAHTSANNFSADFDIKSYSRLAYGVAGFIHVVNFYIGAIIGMHSGSISGDQGSSGGFNGTDLTGVIFFRL